MDQLSIEQLRGVVQARIAELDAYKYMDQALGAAVDADAKVAEAVKKLDMIAEIYEEKSEALAKLDAQYDAKVRTLDERYAIREEQAKQHLAHIQAELDAKRKSLATWQDHLKHVEHEHEQNLAQWTERINAARQELSELQSKLGAVQAQYESFKALVKG